MGRAWDNMKSSTVYLVQALIQKWNVFFKPTRTLAIVMSLESISVENEGAIRLASWSRVPEIMIVAGPNGVGKSTLIECIHENIARGRGQSVDQSGVTDAVYFSPHRAPMPADISESYLAGASQSSYQDTLAEISYNPGSGSNVPNSIRQISGRRSRLRPDIAPYFGVKERLARLKSERGNLLDKVYEREGRVPPGYMPETYTPLDEAISQVLPGLEFEEVGLDEQNNYEIKFRNRGGEVIPFDELSSGERDVVALLFLLIEDGIEQSMAGVMGEDYSPDDLLLLIDGPESYLHPQLQLNFLEFCRDFVGKDSLDREVQMIMATHSQMILENAKGNELFLLLYPDQTEENQLAKADNLEIDLFRSITGELGTAALSTGNPILLIEGKSDREILRRLFPQLENDITVIPMGGKNPTVNLDDALNHLAPELAPLGIDIHAIVDRDQEFELAEKTSSKIKVLPGTCMENLLLINDGIYSALSALADEESLQRVGVNGPGDITPEIQNIVRQEDFKNEEIKHRLNNELMFRISPYGMEDISSDAVEQRIDEVTATKKSRVGDSFASIESEVEAAVESGDFNKLDGKLIFSQLSLRFEVQKDALVKITAEKLAQLDNQPAALEQIVDEISP